MAHPVLGDRGNLYTCVTKYAGLARNEKYFFKAYALFDSKRYKRRQEKLLN